MTSIEQHETAFDPAQPRVALDALPEQAAVYALYAGDERAEPYIGRTPNLRGRLARLLIPSPRHPKRLQLAALVRRIVWWPLGSEFEALLVQFALLGQVYGERAVERMHLRPPVFVRFLGSNRFPRLMVTNRLNSREAQWSYGPFASRGAADRFVDELLKLFLLRRCTEELNPDPIKSGCVYAEMKMCLAPCCSGCTDERYAAEASAVERFLATRGESRLAPLRARRERASAALEFEAAAQAHAQVVKVESVVALVPELVRPLSQLRAVVLQPGAEPGTVALFLFAGGALRGPATIEGQGTEGLGSKEPGSEGVEAGEPEFKADDEAEEAVISAKAQRKVREARLQTDLSALAEAEFDLPPAVRAGHLALLKRWYYRPEARREGEVFFLDPEGGWPIKAILRGAGRVAAAAGS